MAGKCKYAYLGLGPMKVIDSNGKQIKPLRLYRIWHNMKLRVNKPAYWMRSRNGSSYCELVLTLCEEWLDFGNFWRWAMSHGYRDDLTIDRIDNFKGYSPDNCRWATVSEQNKNRRMTEKMLAAMRRNGRLGGMAAAAKRRAMKAAKEAVA